MSVLGLRIQMVECTIRNQQYPVHVEFEGFKSENLSADLITIVSSLRHSFTQSFTQAFTMFCR